MESPENKIARLEHELQELKDEYQDFAYIVSHDLIGALRSIDGFATIITKALSGELNEKTIRHFECMNMGVENAKDILNALLEYSRVSTRIEPFTQCDLNAILQRAKYKLSPLSEPSSATIESDHLPTIMADAGQVSQLFYHLLHNALLYQAADNQPQVQVSYTENPDHWLFSIRDNGIGVKRNGFEKVFQVLRRGVLKKQYPGIGMGLASARKILQRHKGKIWVESTLDEGSTFFFTISKELSND